MVSKEGDRRVSNVHVRWEKISSDYVGMSGDGSYTMRFRQEVVGDQVF
jgi:hypothetical protein